MILITLDFATYSKNRPEFTYLKVRKKATETHKSDVLC